MAATGVIDRFLQKARRRYLANLVFHHGAVALAIGAGGGILLLLVGTQVLNWYWPVLLTLAGLVVGAVRARRAMVSEYRVAQIVDSRLELEDRLSTVHYFRSADGGQAEAVATVERQAEERLTGTDASAAIPIRWPRSGYAAVALLLMCVGMLGVRYGLLHTLNLERPLARIEWNPFTGPPEVQASTKKSVIQERLEEQLKQMGLSLDDLPAPENEALRPQSENIQAVPTAEGELQKGEGEKGQSTGEKGTPGESEEGETGESGEKAEGDGKEGGDAGEPSDGQSAKKQQQAPPKQPKSGKGSEQNNGLMDKMRDAFANMLNKLKSQPGDQQQSQQQASNQSPEGNQQAQGQKGTQSPGKAQQDGQPSPDQQGDRDGEGEKAPGNQSKSAENSSEKPGSQDSKTGMGKQDGNKDIQDAEQLAAMGKISEIFGKRAQQITGEMTVEVPSGKQQLKTAYSQSRGTRTGEGGEVNRDEIPLAYQTYIQRYFEEVRKLPAKPTAPAAR